MANEKVLIVEDQVAKHARPLERILLRTHFNVVGVAKSAQEAITLAKKSRPALVLMDVMLGGDNEDGVFAALEIRRLVGSEIIYLTGVRRSDALLKKIARTRPFGFLSKPYTSDNVIALLDLFRVKCTGNKVVFVCYAHQDGEMKAELCTFLQAIENIGVDPWDDDKICYGDNWSQEIAGAIRRADVAVLLVSVDFVNSKFIKTFELPELLRARDERSMQIINVYVRSVPRAVLQQTGLTAFHGINSPDDPMDRWDRARRERDSWKKLCDALTDVQ